MYIKVGKLIVFYRANNINNVRYALSTGQELLNLSIYYKFLTQH